MDIKTGLEKELKSAELYKSQGLYVEARKAYDAAVKIIEAHPQIKNRENLLSAMVQRIDELEETFEKVEAAPLTHEMTPQVQSLIKNLFTFSNKEDPDNAALDGAITLAKFGQIERAIFELGNLLERDSVRVAAAKNILRCYQLLSKPQKAEEMYREWLSNSFFSPKDLEQVRLFLDKLIAKNETGASIIDPALLDTQRTQPIVYGEAPNELDIGSVIITLDSGPLQGKPIELDVRLQAGNIVSVIIESKEKSLLDNLSVGFRLTNIQFNSTVAIFRGDGIVSAKARIDSGPKRGAYHLDIKIAQS
ncbi:MAG: hypothetical protein RBT11_04325 [Desulfobacterales bacterium]|jgi:hypothetical protein|nr:hypothetical protein [Desulfobacterales bacterium]